MPGSPTSILSHPSIPQVQFQDGGLLSSFPINLFHVASGQQVRCPTFGVGLSEPRRAASISNLGELLAAATSTAINIQDYEFVSQNKVGVREGG